METTENSKVGVQLAGISTVDGSEYRLDFWIKRDGEDPVTVSARLRADENGTCLTPLGPLQEWFEFHHDHPDPADLSDEDQLLNWRLAHVIDEIVDGIVKRHVVNAWMVG